MCDGSGLTPKLNASGGSMRAGNAPFITPRQLVNFLEDFVVIDVREKEEIEVKSDEPTIKNMVAIPMGKMLSSAWLTTEESKKLMESKPKICIVCNSGGRALMVVEWFNANTNYNFYYLKGGILEYVVQIQDNKVVIDDDFLMVLRSKDSGEKVGIALQLCVAATNKGKTVTLVLMHDAVHLMTKSFHANNDLECPKPLSPWNVRLQQLIEKKAQIACCNTCLKIRNIEDKDLIEGGKRIKGTDLIDMMDYCKIQFMY
eukprot:689290_1